MIPNEFGPFVAEQRKKNGLTQAELARQLHVSTAAVSKWERGLCLPELSKFEDIAAVFGLSLMELMQCAEAETIPAEVDAMLSGTIALSRSQSRARVRKWLAAAVAAVMLGVGVYLFPVYHMAQVWPLNYYTTGEIGRLAWIGSGEERDTARLFMARWLATPWERSETPPKRAIPFRCGRRVSRLMMGTGTFGCSTATGCGMPGAARSAAAANARPCGFLKGTMPGRGG